MILKNNYLNYKFYLFVRNIIFTILFKKTSILFIKKVSQLIFFCFFFNCNNFILFLIF